MGELGGAPFVLKRSSLWVPETQERGNQRKACSSPQEPVTMERVGAAEGRGRGAGPQERPEECRELG